MPERHRNAGPLQKHNLPSQHGSPQRCCVTKLMWLVYAGSFTAPEPSQGAAEARRVSRSARSHCSVLLLQKASSVAFEARWWWLLSRFLPQLVTVLV